MSAFGDLVLRRYSCRAYKPDPVPREMIMQIIEAARQAPSACNRQPWRFAVVTDQERRRKIVQNGFRTGLGMRWAEAAPVFLVLGIKKEIIVHRLAPAISGVDYALLDLGIAGEHAVLQAAELGLGTCWIGWIKPGTVRKIVGWPIGIAPRSIITVGWPAAAEERLSTRLPLSEIARWVSE